MEFMFGLLAVSLCANAFQLYLAKKTKKKPKLDLSAQDILHDLTHRGQAVVRIQVVDASDFLLRSPRT